MSGPNVNMNSRNGYCFEVPIVNLHDVEISDIVPKTEDDDCTIIEPENSQKLFLSCNTTKALANVVENQTRNFDIIIDIDCLKNNDCTIIENQNLGVSIEEPIVLDEDSERENDCSIIDTYIQEIQPNYSGPSRSLSISSFDVLYRQDKLLAELIENCLNMENSTSMSRIINRTLIPIYNDTSRDFKRSNYYQKALVKTIRKLAVEPSRKFSHLKELCEVMKKSLSHAPQCLKRGKARKTCKSVKAKNRVQSKRKLPGKSTSSETSSCGSSIPKKKAKTDVIDLDDDDDDVIIANTDQISNIKCEAVETSSILSIIHESHVAITNYPEYVDVKINEHNAYDEPMKTDYETNDQSSTDHGASELNETNDLVPINDETNSLSSTDDETNDLSPTDDETNHLSPTDDETNSLSPTDDETYDLSPTDDETNHLSPVNDETNSLSPTDDETNDLSPTDDETNDPSPIDDETNEDIKVDDDVILIEDANQNSNKENITVTFKQTKNKTATSIPDIKFAEKRQNGYIDNKTFATDNNKYEEIPNFRENVNISPEDAVKRKIEELERKIKSYHEMIAELEQKEVDWNSTHDSPYLQSQWLKTKLISSYKELCKLSGTDSVKRHKVRLKVVQGRHEGPVRCLEKFINDNIGEDGKPPFPDLYDVIECVSTANTMYQLGWSEKQVKTEAQALFIHYGRTVQKRRQKREWRDLMLYVKEEVPDPADEDPALQARLNENAKLASKNEKDLFNRHVQIENSVARSIARISVESSDSEKETDSRETSSIHKRIVPNRVFNSATSNNTTVFNNRISISSTEKSSNHYQTSDGGTSSVCKKIVPAKVTIHNSASALNNTFLHNNRTSLISNNENSSHYQTSDRGTSSIHEEIRLISATIPNSATEFNNTSLFNNKSVLNNETVSNNSTFVSNNKTSSNFQTTDNIVNQNSNEAIQRLIIIPPEMATYPVKYTVVVDDNMQPVGIIANPQKNSDGSLFTSNIESLKNNMPDNTKDTCEVTNSSNTEDRTVQQHNNMGMKREINYQADIKSVLNDMRTSSIENIEASTTIDSVNENSFESSNKSSQAYFEINRGKKSNIGYFVTESLQYNEVSTNSEAEIITINDVESEDISLNNEVSSTSRVCAKTCDLINDKVSETGCKTCEVGNATGSTRSGGKTCGLINDTISSKNTINYEPINDIQPSASSGAAAGDKTCGLVNDAAIAGSSNTNLNEIVLKKEKLDIPRMLEALGDNYTVNILSIEDPFEVIDISDSSDSEDDL